MLSAQVHYKSAENTKTNPKGKRSASLGLILIGIALLSAGLLLYLYYLTNRPKIVTAGENFNMRNASRPLDGNASPPPTPAVTASPAMTREK